MRKTLIYVFSGLVLAIVVSIALAWTPDIEPDTLVGKYGGSRSQFIKLPSGDTIHFRKQGKADGPKLVLLHGSNSSLHTWEPWVKQLGEHFSILTLDLPGHGLTGPIQSEDYTQNGMVRTLHSLLVELGYTDFFLGGNSMGGGVTLAYTLAHPQRVQGMILIDSAGVSLPNSDANRDLPLAFQLAGRWYTDWILENITPRSLAAEGLRKSVSNQDIVTDAAIDRYWELVRFPGNRRATGLRFASYRNSEGLSLPVGQIKTPALILWGADDSLIPVATAHVLNQELPNSRKVIYENIGHLPMEEKPIETAKEAKSFMENTLSRS